MTLTTGDIIVIVCYFLLIVGIGLYYSKKITSSESFVVADRSLNMKVMIGTTVATCMGSGAVMADVGFTYESGVGALIVIATFNVGWIALILMSRKLRASGCTTLPDFLGKTYGHSTKTIAAIVTLVAMVASTAAQIAGCGTIMAALGLTSKTTGILIGFVVIMLITIFGGLYSVAITDTIQAVLLTLGIGIILPIVAFKAAGGVGEVFSTVDHVNANILDLGSISAIEIIGYIFVYIFNAGSHAGYSQRIMASVDEKTAVRGSIWSNLITLVMAFSIVSVAFCAYKLIPGLEDPEMIVPLLIGQLFPPVVRGALLASLIALVISTADSFLLLLGTTCANDIYRSFKPDISGDQLLKLSRIFTVAGGVIALALALTGGNVFTLMRSGGAAYGAGMFIPLLCACFAKNLKTKAINIGMILGCFTTLIWNAVWKASTGVNGVIVGGLICLICVFLLSAIFKNDQRPETQSV